MPECAIETTIRSLSDATIAQYNGTYKLWWNFCKGIDLSPFEGQTSHVITFLQGLLDNHQAAYGSFNSHRSALSLILSGNLGGNPLLKRFMKGIFKCRPPKPKYDFVWDPQPVLRFLEQTSTSCLKNLSRKLVTLLALATGHRLQTISLIRTSQIVETAREIQIFIPDLIKTSRPNRSQPCLQLPFFEDRPSLCVASTLKTYLEATANLRDSQSVDDFLFLTHRRPHRLATKQTLSRWVKETLKLAGVDIKQFTPHSTRHAATSAAYREGVSLDVIQQTAGWSRNSEMFARFYQRPLTDHALFATAILHSNAGQNT